jgi:hypothetical protein
MVSTVGMARLKLAARKHASRQAKAAAVRRNQVRAMPAIPRVILAQNYVNPITLGFPRNIVVYEIRNRATGRTNYYNKETFRKLITTFKNDYALLMANPKVPIPGARNPVTRGPIYPRNIRRVTVKPKRKTPTRSAAANKIKKAIKKHISRKSR